MAWVEQVRSQDMRCVGLACLGSGCRARTEAIHSVIFVLTLVGLNMHGQARFVS